MTGWRKCVSANRSFVSTAPSEVLRWYSRSSPLRRCELIARVGLRQGRSVGRVEDDTLRDQCRREVAGRGLVPAAAAHLTRDAFGEVAFSQLTSLKGLIKQFFSDRPWTTDDDRTLADVMGQGDGWWSHVLGGDFELEFGWRAGDFHIGLSPVAPGAEPAVPDTDEWEGPIELHDRAELLAETFGAAVIPEATPNPRTIRFVTGPIHTGPSRWYASAVDVDDARAAALFREFDAIDNVLVGPDFVAVGLHHSDGWEALLGPVLRVVATQFSGSADPPPPAPTMNDEPATSRTPRAREGSTDIERAWRELGALRADRRDDLVLILAARSSSNIADRQVAARLLAEADPAVAQSAWNDLLADASRTVRRATVDAMVDTERAALRPLLERGLHDADPWIRWKALRGLMGLGIEPSRDAVAPLAADGDFRVRLEATSALRDSTDD